MSNTTQGLHLKQWAQGKWVRIHVFRLVTGNTVKLHPSAHVTWLKRAEKSTLRHIHAHDNLLLPLLFSLLSAPCHVCAERHCSACVAFMLVSCTSKPRLFRFCPTRVVTASSFETTLDCALTRVGQLAQHSIEVRCSYLRLEQFIALDQTLRTASKQRCSRCQNPRSSCSFALSELGVT